MILSYDTVAVHTAALLYSRAGNYLLLFRELQAKTTSNARTTTVALLYTLLFLARRPSQFANQAVADFPMHEHPQYRISQIVNDTGIKRLVNFPRAVDSLQTPPAPYTPHQQRHSTLSFLTTPSSTLIVVLALCVSHTPGGRLRVVLCLVPTKEKHRKKRVYEQYQSIHSRIKTFHKCGTP